MEYELICATAATLFECFEAIIAGLKHAKKEYHRNSSRTKAAKEARKRAEEDELDEEDPSHNHNRRLRRRQNVCFCL